MHTIGRHIIAELYDADENHINDVSYIRESMLAAAKAVGATVVGETFHHFAPQGVSGTVVIAESHLSIHTWPESGYVAVDIYTCGGLDPHPGIAALCSRLNAQAFRVQEIVRGLPDELRQQKWSAADVSIISDVSPVQLVQAA